MCWGPPARRWRDGGRAGQPSQRLPTPFHHPKPGQRPQQTCHFWFCSQLAGACGPTQGKPHPCGGSRGPGMHRAWWCGAGPRHPRNSGDALGFTKEARLKATLRLSTEETPAALTPASLKTLTSSQPVISLLGNHPIEVIQNASKYLCTKMVTAALFLNFKRYDLNV